MEDLSKHEEDPYRLTRDSLWQFTDEELAEWKREYKENREKQNREIIKQLNLFYE